MGAKVQTRRMARSAPMNFIPQIPYPRVIVSRKGTEKAGGDRDEAVATYGGSSYFLSRAFRRSIHPSIRSIRYVDQTNKSIVLVRIDPGVAVSVTVNDDESRWSNSS
jgi:hypothetical protein